MFILDRTNGKPVFGVEERPVPKGDVPGEWYSPTQPFPLKPPPLWRASALRRKTWSPRRTPRRSTRRPARSCGSRTAASSTRGLSRRWNFHEEGDPPKSTIQFPGGTGGVNWGGTAADPQDRLRVRQHARRIADRMDRKEEAGRKLRPRAPRAPISPTIARASTAPARITDSAPR